MSKAADDEIVAWSLGKNAMVVTLHADFHTILAVSGASGPSVIRHQWAVPIESAFEGVGG
jgi:predicted nuclease of predicted toxin-antitoxin system